MYRYREYMSCSCTYFCMYIKYSTVQYSKVQEYSLRYSLLIQRSILNYLYSKLYIPLYIIGRLLDSERAPS